ncbi:hypothetical protein Avbf_08270 [Armadillidium vulgare]|nr:hypothetical protein Avbf_08270 [Armadillidium vulgare]
MLKPLSLVSQVNTIQNTLFITQGLNVQIRILYLDNGTTLPSYHIITKVNDSSIREHTEF